MSFSNSLRMARLWTNDGVMNVMCYDILSSTLVNVHSKYCLCPSVFSVILLTMLVQHDVCSVLVIVGAYSWGVNKVTWHEAKGNTKV